LRQQAFEDAHVAAVLTVIAGYNSNQLLRYVDWELIGSHPKVLCGYSDISALQHAMWAKTRLVTYSGPHYSTFGQKLYAEYTVDYVVSA
jgi:muramoyltetrapeptide carboxypeptidase LdcA involved in peptidoglycan recycling